jgi:hypothetical protein
MPQHRSSERARTEYRVTHQGVPIGTVELPREGDRFTVAVYPLPAYAAIQSVVRSASGALVDVALGRPANAADLQRGAALGRALELRDVAGALVPADFIELTDWPGRRPEVAAFVRLRETHAPVLADVLPPTRGDSDASTPAA